MTAKDRNKFIFLLSVDFFVGFERIVQILIEKDANVNAVNEKEYSAIVSAAEKGKLSKYIQTQRKA